MMASRVAGQAGYGGSAPGRDRDQDAVLEIEIAAPSINMLLANVVRHVHTVDRDRLRPAGFFRFRFRHADLRLAEPCAVCSRSLGGNLWILAEEVHLVIGTYVTRFPPIPLAPVVGGSLVEEDDLRHREFSRRQFRALNAIQ